MRTSSLILALLMAAFAARSLRVSLAHDFPAYDEVAYLDTARQFSGLRLAGTVASHLRGEWRQEQRNPLYMMALSPLMQGRPADFARAKGASLLFLLLLFLSMAYFSGRLWGPTTGLAACAALAFSPAGNQLSVYVSADGLLGLLYFTAAASLALWHGRRPGWLAFGVLAGLAYLAKGNGHLLLASGAACAAWKYRGASYKRREPWLALAGFAAVSSFLVFRNLRVWGEPFHSNAAKWLWLDSGADWWRVAETPVWDELGFAWYFQRHTALDALRRLGEGAVSVTWTLIKAMAVGVRTYPYWLLTGGGLLVLSLAGFRRRWREGAREEVLAFAGAGGALFCLFCWAAKSTDTPLRYLFPLAATLWPWAAVGARGFVPKARRKAASGLVRAAVLVLACGVLTAQVRALASSPRRFWAVPESWAATSSWLCGRVGEEGFLIDSLSDYSTWDLCRDRRRPYPFTAPNREIADVAARHGVRHILIDRRCAEYDGALPRWGPLDARGPTSFLGWPRCFHDPGPATRFVVFCKPPGS